jgi:hypothetical protein
MAVSFIITYKKLIVAVIHYMMRQQYKVHTNNVPCVLSFSDDYLPRLL